MSEFIPPGHINELLHNLDKLDDLNKQYRRDFDSLSPRELDVFRLIAQGLNNRAIADTLEITRPTVQNHRAHIRRKIRIRTEADYYVLALAMGLISF